MFGRKPKVESLKLQEAENLVLDQLLTADPEEPQYETLLKRLDEIKSLQSKDKRRIDPNTMLLAGAGLLQVVVIVGYEHAHVVTTKATAFVLKPR